MAVARVLGDRPLLPPYRRLTTRKGRAVNELVMRGDICVVPREEGGCNLLLAGGEDLLYRKPLDPPARAKLIQELSLSNEELRVEMARRAAGQRLRVASANGHLN
jgi:hypothetical protein